MAYSTSSPPAVFWPAIGGGKRLWVYTSSTDPLGTIGGSGYFSNGDALGMKLYDMVLAMATTTASTAGSQPMWGFVSSVTASSAATVTFTTST
jgi:hypothetical protein